MNQVSLIGHLLELLGEVDQGKGPADRIAGEYFRARKYLGSHDRRFIADTLYGVIRHRRRAEAVFERYIAGHPSDTELDAPRVRYLPLLAAYAVLLAGGGAPAFEIPDSLWMTQFPRVPLDRFLAGVSALSALGFLAGEEEAVRLGVTHSFQDWMAAAWLARFGPAADAFMASLNAPAEVAIRVNGLKTTREACRERLAAEGIESAPSTLAPGALRIGKRFSAASLGSYREGWFEMQDEGSQIVGLAAAPVPGSLVFDACAGAGGKTLHLAELMRNSGRIIAADPDPRRLGELQERAIRGGVSIVETSKPGSVKELAADLVVVDAPCSGIGTVRRNPSMKWTIAEEEIPRHAERQLSILTRNAAFVKPGGKLLYSTCSFFREENEEVVQRFLASVPGFAPEPLPSGLPATDGGAYLSLLPHLHGTDGFFVAVMRREG